MQLNSPKSRFHKETCLLQITSLVILLLIGLLSGCNAYQKNRDGLTFIASRGMLPVQSIVWSPTDENRILATAFSVGQWPAYIYLLDLKTGQKQAVAKTDSGWFHKATWTSDGKNVLILAGDNTREFEPPGWWKVDIASDSSEHLKDLGYTVVTWSPDGKMMVTESGGDVYLTNVITEAEEIIHKNIESIDDYRFT